eukprot:TRINITY_DN14677_c0_g1_i1.p1 TRINITY_DN14677_c0_g1~~TRINITY_DN14677_c0_g1_i1.p1  ORF type:complete len:460 (+),score=95.57 TRINITY_DN14677_c0_g1_i1:73-1380(+)
MSFMTHLECSTCQRQYSPDIVIHLCECGRSLLVRYDLQRISQEWSKDQLRDRPPTMWRYRELLPVRSEDNVVSLGEGMTPLLKIPKAGKEIGLPECWLKDEGCLPTGSFKARGAACGVSRVKELGIRTVALPTNGNAGGAWAAYCARAGVDLVLCMPSDTPLLNVVEVMATGAHAFMVDGLISDAGLIIRKACEKHGWFEAATLKEPYRVEGKKTMGLEIAEQFGWQLPDAILYPTGGGVGIIAIYKAFVELEAIGWIKRPFPKLIAVQPTGCAPIVKAFHEGKAVSEFWKDAKTVQHGTRVPKALGDYLVLEAVRATEGTCVAVSDADALWALDFLAKHEGAFVCPEGAALLAGARQLVRDGFLTASDRVVLLNTGAGLKYPDLFRPGGLARSGSGAGASERASESMNNGRPSFPKVPIGGEIPLDRDLNPIAV